LMAIQREREEAEAQEKEHQIEKERVVESTRMENCPDLATLRAYNMRLEAENRILAELAEAQEARDEGGREAVAQRKKCEKEFVIARGAGSPRIQAVYRQLEDIWRSKYSLYIDDRLYEWVDPRFAQKWKDVETKPCVCFDTRSPVHKNHSLRTMMSFKRKDSTIEDWVDYIKMNGSIRYKGKPLPQNHFLVHRRVGTLEPFIRERVFVGLDIGQYVITHNCSELRRDQMLSECWCPKVGALWLLTIYFNNEQPGGLWHG
jgi:hypothetical protein